jgi:DTW domain-containing protein YfiP
LRVPLCLCSEIPSLKPKTKIIVVMHWRERVLTSNTAHLSALALPGSEIHLRGRKDAPLDLNALVNQQSRFTPLLLFPGETAEVLSPQWVATHPGPYALFVPDGSWRQAKKVALREPALKQVRQVKLCPDQPGQYLLRKAAHPEMLSTMEAISRALEFLEGESEGPKIRHQLDLLFQKFNERIQWSRGKLAAEKTQTGIPLAAFEASRAAGIRGSKK